eukprot:7014324-Ditylum_brightwellii.AAC.1
MKIEERRKVARETDAGVVSGNRNFIATDVDENEDKEGAVGEDEAVNVDADHGADILQLEAEEEF